MNIYIPKTAVYLMLRFSPDIQLFYSYLNLLFTLHMNILQIKGSPVNPYSHNKVPYKLAL